MGVKRSIYIEDGAECVVHVAGKEGLRIEEIDQAGNCSDVSSKLMGTQNAMYKDFVYTDEMVESCGQMELSLYIAVGIVAVFLALVVAIAVVLVRMLGYRRRLYQMLDERGAPKELSGAQRSLPNMMPPTK